MKILIIDNYDSFTYNLYQQIGELLDEKRVKGEVVVRRNDAITLGKAKQFERIILSAGPGHPADRAYFGVCADILQHVKTIPVLGVCLGMQGMAHYFGGKVISADRMMHGKTSVISHDGKGIFTNVPQGIQAMRYHSLIADLQSLPAVLQVTATVFRDPAAYNPRSMTSLVSFPIGAQAGIPSRVTPLGFSEIMGLRHSSLPIEGVQFHPESFATEAGKLMLSNFLFRRKV
ncbi:MAG: aminodeoxychorismate/anthranilate synthase component II [Patescibacteria group bacterium]|nr:aminodeoxychorismate/anthranilate synthase component II [Patescibacteria group bacterium]